MKMKKSTFPKWELKPQTVAIIGIPRHGGVGYIYFTYCFIAQYRSNDDQVLSTGIEPTKHLLTFQYNYYCYDINKPNYDRAGFVFEFLLFYSILKYAHIFWYNFSNFPNDIAEDENEEEACMIS